MCSISRKSSLAACAAFSVLLTATPGAAAAPATARLLSMATPPRIDGDAEEWPTWEGHTLKGQDGSATFWLGADAANLYVLVKVQDKSPLRNNAVRPEENLKGGDAVALYLGGAGQEQRVLFAQRDKQTEIWVHRPKSAIKKPYTFASPVSQVTLDYVAPLTEASGRFRTAPGGYLLEAALPWKSLGYAARPVATPFELQVIFSDAAGQTNSSMAWWNAKGSPGDTVEDLPTEARLYPDTWGVASVAGAPVGIATAPAAVPGIPITVDVPRTGRLSLNITDEKGFILRELVMAEAVTKGAYTTQWDGRDRYGAALPPGRYRWKALVFGGMGTQFMGSVGNSSRPPYRTADGLGSMGGQHGVPTSLAADEGGVYMGSGAEEGQPALRKIDTQTGVAQWKRSMGGFGVALAVAANEGMAAIVNRTHSKGTLATDLVRIDPATGKDVPMGEGKAAASRVKLELPSKGNPVGGMAIAGKRAYWSHTEANQICGINLESGAPLPNLNVPAPLGLARLDANTLLVCSGSSVLKLNLTSGTTTPLLSQLQAPRAVAVDKEGKLYVAELGTAQVIRKFSAQGAPLATWGKPGGKPHTMLTYDPLAFSNIVGLQVGPDGNLWVCEAVAMPKRFIKMSTAGAWLEDFYGPVAYNTFGPDIHDLRTVYYNPGGNQNSTQVIETRLDYKKYAADPANPAAGWKIEAVHDLSRGADGKSLNPLMGEVADAGYGHYYAFTGANEKKYLFRPSKHNRAVAPVGAGLWVKENGAWVPCAFFSRDETKAASWADANGDGLMQDTERYTGVPAGGVAWIGKDFTLHGEAGTLAVASTDARGVPHYAGSVQKKYLAAGTALNSEDPRNDGWTFFSPEVDESVYYVSNLGPHRHLSAWDRASENRLTRVMGGVVQWIVGTHSPRPKFTEMSTASGIAGVVDDIVLVHVVEPAIYIAYTTDGFNLGNVIADPEGNRVTVGPTAIHIESFTGFFTKDPASGKMVLFTVSSGDDRILEVTGPGQTFRSQGTLELDTSRPMPGSGATLMQIPYENMYGNVARGQGVDGHEWDWTPEGTGTPLYLGTQVVGDVRLRRDAGSLHVFAHILDGTPLSAGDGLELQLSPQAAGTPVVLKMQMGQDKDGKPMVTATLDGKDLTRTAKDKRPATIEVAVLPRWQKLGHKLEARIPLHLLPTLTADKEQTFRQAQGAELIKTTLTLPDLQGPLRLKATLLQDGKAAGTWPATEPWGMALVP